MYYKELMKIYFHKLLVAHISFRRSLTIAAPKFVAIIIIYYFCGLAVVGTLKFRYG